MQPLSDPQISVKNYMKDFTNLNFIIAILCKFKNAAGNFVRYIMLSRDFAALFTWSGYFLPLYIGSFITTKTQSFSCTTSAQFTHSRPIHSRTILILPSHTHLVQ